MITRRYGDVIEMKNEKQLILYEFV